MPLIKVDDDFPPPPVARIERKYPFGDMQVGQSFFAVRASKTWPLSSIGNKRHAPKRFTQRNVIEDGVAGIRVWRIA